MASALPAALAILLVGCSSSQGAGEGMQVMQTAEGTTVPVELDDYVIRMPEEIPAGDLVFDVRNVGDHEHTIKIEGNGVDAPLPSHPRHEGRDQEDRINTVKQTPPLPNR
jgi:hypothetical protein